MRIITRTFLAAGCGIACYALANPNSNEAGWSDDFLDDNQAAQFNNPDYSAGQVSTGYSTQQTYNTPSSSVTYRNSPTSYGNGMPEKRYSTSASNSVLLGNSKLGGSLQTGYSTHQFHRGFEMGENVFNAELTLDFALSERFHLVTGAYARKGMSGNNFADTAAYGELIWIPNQKNEFHFGVTAHNYSNSIFEDGAELIVGWDRSLVKNISIYSQLIYDTGNEGWYGSSELNFNAVINERTNANLSAGVSWVSDYLNRDGYNNTFIRANLEYQLSKRLFLQPHIGVNFPADGDGEDQFYGGANLKFVF